MKKIKNIIIVSIFLIGAISGFLFFELQENAEAIKPYKVTTTSELVDYIKDNNISYDPYTITSRDGSVVTVIPDGVYHVDCRITIECGVMKYLDNGKMS